MTKTPKPLDVFSCAKKNVYIELTSGDRESEFSGSSKAESFSLENQATCALPNCLQLSKLDAIASYVPWYSTVYRETGGDDSVTHVPVGRKLMLIAN